MATLSDATNPPESSDSACSAAATACVHDALPLPVSAQAVGDRPSSPASSTQPARSSETGDGTKPAELTPGVHPFSTNIDGTPVKYTIYAPQHPKNPPQVDLAGDGFTRADSDPSFKMGDVNGVYAQAEKAGTYVVIPEPHTTFHANPKYLFTRNLYDANVGWNVPNSPSGYYPNELDDRTLVRGVIADAAKHIPGFDPSKPLPGCIGFSEFNSVINAVNEPQPGVEQKPLCSKTAEFDGTVLTNEPKPLPGVSELIVRGDHDPLLPGTGGISFSTKQGKLETLFNVIENNGNMYKSAPYLQFPNAAEANGLNPADAKTTDSQFFTEKTARPNAQGVGVTEYVLKGDYGGHSFPGRLTGGANESADSASNGKPVPPQVFDGAKIAFCFFGQEKGPQCDQPGDSNTKAPKQ